MRTFKNRLEIIAEFLTNNGTVARVIETYGEITKPTIEITTVEIKPTMEITTIIKLNPESVLRELSDNYLHTAIKYHMNNMISYEELFNKLDKVFNAFHVVLPPKPELAKIREENARLATRATAKMLSVKHTILKNGDIEIKDPTVKLENKAEIIKYLLDRMDSKELENIHKCFENNEFKERATKNAFISFFKARIHLENELALDRNNI